MGDFNSMNKAYQASKVIIDKRMEKERKEDLEHISQIADNEILIVQGQYDRIEQVFDILQIKYGLLSPSQLRHVSLHPSQTLIINCPGDGIGDPELQKIKAFVAAGGFLFSTDWVLKNVLEQIFPEYVQYNRVESRDDVVKVEVVDKSSPYLKGLFEKNAEPMWWLETASYPIRIVNPEKVKILIQSQEMKERYGEAPIVVTFNYGQGTVFHMVSHYYLQRADLRSDRHKKSASAYAYEEMNLSQEEMKGTESQLAGVSLGEVESAYSSAQFMLNAMAERKKDQKAKNLQVPANLKVPKPEPPSTETDFSSSNLPVQAVQEKPAKSKKTPKK